MAEAVDELGRELPDLFKKRDAIYFPSQSFIKRFDEAKENITRYGEIDVYTVQEHNELMHEIDRATVIQQHLLKPYSLMLSKAENKLSEVNMGLRSQVTIARLSRKEAEDEINSVAEAIDSLRRQELVVKSRSEQETIVDSIGLVLEKLEEHRPLAKKAFEQPKQAAPKPVQNPPVKKEEAKSEEGAEVSE